ncbi:MAG: crossover junction endodeoxyribonuclease RuvC [Deltaproteobacteria bacterium]|nr:crossover junction endodeoxyribonuclease RuvC [Deltaproteobacteria bacterium]MBZ0218955.1 crossover junction endodeoxyribonuclease RuvC [Deltaproteobacteria bacterium]
MVLGIDPGSVSTGYGIVERKGNALVRVCHGDISPGAGLPLSSRLLCISKRLREIIEEFRPEAVSLESVFYAKNARSAIILGQARGALLVTVAEFGIPVYEYSPSSVKQAVTGNGRAAKEDVQKMVGLLLKAGLIEGKKDATDALALAICHLNSHSSGLRIKGEAALLSTRRTI